MALTAPATGHYLEVTAIVDTGADGTIVPVRYADGGEDMSRIEEMIKELPSELQQEVLDFVKFLIAKRERKRGRKLRQDWAGALRGYRNQYTSLELQKKALEWRGD